MSTTGRAGQTKRDRWCDIDTGPHRAAIRAALTRHLPLLTGTVLDLGCGDQPYRGLLTTSPSRVERYLGLDLPDDRRRYATPPDLTWDGRTIPLEAESMDGVLATELLEHCPDANTVLREVARVLKRNGIFFFTVPFLWPLHETPSDFHRFTPYALQHVLSECGFADVQLESLGGWDAALAQMLGLWARRRPRRQVWRRLCTLAVFPVVSALRRFDRPPAAFGEGTMLTGLAGWARKVGV